MDVLLADLEACLVAPAIDPPALVETTASTPRAPAGPRVLAIAVLSLAAIGFLVERLLHHTGSVRPGTLAPELLAEVRGNRVPDPRPSAPSPQPRRTVVAKVQLAPEPPEHVGVVKTFRHGAGMVEGVAVAADGRRALSGGNDGTVHLWNLETGTRLLSLAGSAPVFAVALAPDGRRAATAGAETTVRHWDLHTGAKLGEFEGHTKKVNAVAFSPSGDRLASASDDRAVRLWDTESRQTLLVFKHDQRVNALAFFRDGRHVMSAGADRLVRVHATADGSEVARFPESAEVFCLAISPDSRLALWGGVGGRLAVCRLDTPGQEPPRRLEGGPHDWVRCVALLPDGRHALAGYEGGTLLAWDLDSGRLVQTLDDHPPGRLGLAPLPDGLHVLTSDADGCVRLWRLPPLGAGSAR
jgi:WD40 repeat protein